MRRFIPEEPSRGHLGGALNLTSNGPHPLLTDARIEWVERSSYSSSCQGQEMSLPSRSPVHGFPPLWHSGSQTETDFLYHHPISSLIYSKTISNCHSSAFYLPASVSGTLAAMVTTIAGQHKHTCAHACTHCCTQTRVHTHSHMHTHTQTYTQWHIHACTPI